MRKTSHDGADSSSITSGKDSDAKKSTTSFHKMKKSSIKRKVQTFSHESDEGIIEPLLQTDKEKIEIANRSAKFLLNKSKTESMNEKDNKVTEGNMDKCSVDTPVSSTSIMFTNNVKEMPASTSYVSGSAPMHNHMNTNIFSTYDTTTGLINKNQILIEIDTSNPGRFSPSPLIFTTAKIHTDSKTKIMEPVQMTPVPILSTIEGDIIKAGVASHPETKTNGINKKCDGIKAFSAKPETNGFQASKDSQLTPTVTNYFLNSEMSNGISKKVSNPNSIEGSSCLFSKDIKVCQSNTVILAKADNLVNQESTSLKQQPITDILRTNTISNTNLPTEKPTCASSSKNTLEKLSSQETVKESSKTLGKIDNKSSTSPLNLTNEFAKTSLDSDSKKIQCEKNSSNDAIINSVNKVTKPDTYNTVKEKDCFSDKSIQSPKLLNKSDSATIVIPISTKASTPYSSQFKGGTTLSLAEAKTTPITESTSKLKSNTSTVNLKPTSTTASKVGNKSQSKSLAMPSQSEIEGSNESSKALSVNPISSIELSPSSSIGSNPVISTSTCSSQIEKTDLTIKPTVTSVKSTLPPYIVSTSKTKIGSTLTSNTSAITSKSQIQKPIVNVNVTNAFAITAPKPSTSASAANGTKPKNVSKQTKPKAEMIKKDGRA